MSSVTKSLGRISVSVIVGCLAGWWTFRYLYRVEILRYDRTVFDRMHYDCFFYPPLLIVARDDEDLRFYAQPFVSGPLEAKPLASKEQFEQFVAWSPYVVLDESATIADLLWIESLGNIRFLIARRNDNWYDVEQMRELRLSPSPESFFWHMEEWSREADVMEYIEKEVPESERERLRKTRRRFFLPFWQ